jgi:hypothetical protein
MGKHEVHSVPPALDCMIAVCVHSFIVDILDAYAREVVSCEHNHEVPEECVGMEGSQRDRGTVRSAARNTWRHMGPHDGITSGTECFACLSV